MLMNSRCGKTIIQPIETDTKFVHERSRECRTCHSSVQGRCTIRAPRAREDVATANLRTNIMDFRGFDSSRILILSGGILMPIGDFPESFCQAILVGIMLVGRLGVGRRQEARGTRKGAMGREARGREAKGERQETQV